MFRGETQGGVVFCCDGEGRVKDVLADDLGLFDRAALPSRFEDLLDVASREKYRAFLKAVTTHGAALSWELNVLLEKGPEAMSFFGFFSEERVFCIVSRSPHQLFQLYDELLRMLNEQSERLRASQKECAQLRSSDDARYADFMSLNNELVNARRELTLKNFQIEAQERRIRSIINAVPEALFVVLRSGCVRFANQAALSLFDGCPELGERWLPMIRECVSESGEVCMLGDDRVNMELRATEIEWEGETAFLVSMRDVTARNRLEEVREEMDRIAKHDIKSPLGGIIGLSGMLRESKEVPEKERELMGMIQDAGFRILNMVNRSLDLYKMERGTYVLETGDVDLVPLVLRTLNEREPLASARQLGMDVSLNGRPLEKGDKAVVCADEALCYSMLGNLVTNAVEASPAGGIVRVELEQSETGTLIRILNQGAVPEQIRDRFFEKFVTAGKRYGTGIGTYSARLIARTLGGDIAMRTDERTGTAVTIRLS